VDASPIGRAAAELMESIEAQVGEDSKVGTVAIIVEVDSKENEEPGTTHIFYRCSDSRAWVQYGLFACAARVVYGK